MRQIARFRRWLDRRRARRLALRLSEQDLALLASWLAHRERRPDILGGILR